MNSKVQGLFSAGMIMRPAKQIIAVLCVWLLISNPLPTWAGQSERQELQIVVLQGDGETNLITGSRREQLVVEVRRGDQPVKGANVDFQLPESGPGGSFKTKSNTELKTLRVTTGAKGRAVIKSYVANTEIGDYIIRVKTTYGDQTAEAELRQTNAWVNSNLIGKKFNVRLKDYQVVKGRLSQITEGGFTLVDDKSNQSRLVANEDVAVLSQSHISPLVYIGIGIGAIFGIALIAYAASGGS